jgi:SAM-dependent methyltransferase
MIQTHRCECCGGGGLIRVGRNEDFIASHIYFCARCKTASTYPAPDDKTLGDFYDSSYSQTNRTRQTEFGSYDVRAKTQVASIVRSGLFVGATEGREFAGLRAVDIGCGPGSLLVEFQQRGASVLGYDPDSAVANVARSRLNGNGDVHGQLFDPSAYPEGSFDLISLSHVLEHVTHPGEFIAKLIRLLTSKGCLFIEVPNYNLQRTKQFLHRSFRGSGHVNFFNRAGLSRLIESRGGKVALIESAGPELRRTEVPFGQARNRLRDRMLKLEKSINGILERRGMRQAPLSVTLDDLSFTQPAHIDGLYLRCVSTPAAP